MEKLITSEDLYYQLQHHPDADCKKASIQYIDFKRLKTIPYHEWIPEKKGGLVPWHRVQGFLYCDEVLWDRANRQFNPELYNKVSTFSNIDMLKYNGKMWCRTMTSDIAPNNISVISFNCLMDIYEKHITNIKFRIQHIISWLQEYNADVVCLQEITNEMKEKIMNNKFIRNNYCITSNLSKIYQNIILSKFIPKSQNLISFGGSEIKKYVHIVLECAIGHVDIINLHLTSGCQINHDEKQCLQLEQLFNSDIGSKVIICGDFNNDKPITELDYYDAWEQLRPDDEGFTVSPDTNVLTNKLSRSFTNARIDRMVCRNVLCNDINIVFNVAIDDYLFPSDHYGIMSNFDITQSLEIKNYIPKAVKCESYTLSTQYRLCSVLNIDEWEKINKIRKLYDENVNKIAPHVTLFSRFVDDNYWPVIKEHIATYDEVCVFDNLEIFAMEKRFALVLTCNDNEKINSICSKIAFELNITHTINPHITLGFFDSEAKANAVLQRTHVQTVLHLNNIVYYKNCQVYDYVGTLNDMDPVQTIETLLHCMIPTFTLDQIGSRAMLNVGNDYDLILNTDSAFDVNAFVRLCRLTPYVKYVEYIGSKIPTITILLHDDIDVDLLLNNNDPSLLKARQIVTFVNDMKDNSFFKNCLLTVREWAKRRQIYGKKLGFFGGIVWLVLTYNVYIMKQYTNKKQFFAEFLSYYADYDWTVPVNPCNREISMKAKSDHIVYISCMNEDHNAVRTITIPNFCIIQKEFQRVHEFKLLNDLCLPYVFTGKIITVHITDRMPFARIKKIKLIMANIWKTTINNLGIRPSINYTSTDTEITYNIEYINVGAYEAISNYVNPFLCTLTSVGESAIR